MYPLLVDRKNLHVNNYEIKLNYDVVAVPNHPAPKNHNTLHYGN